MYRRLFYGATVVVVGVMGQVVARGWLARELTGTNTGLGGVFLVFGVAMLVATPFGGVVADRRPKRLVIMVAVGALAGSALAIGVAVAVDVIAYWMLLATSAIQAAAFAFYLPARIALISELVPGALIQNAVVLAQMSQEAVRVVAPAAAGALMGISWFGVGGVFLAAGGAMALSLIPVMRLPRVPPRDTHGRSPLGEMADAAAYVRTNPDLLSIALVTIGVVMVGFPYLTFLPALADDRFDGGALAYGVMAGAAGLGAVIAGVFDASFNAGTRPWRTIGLSGAAFGVALVVLGYAETFATAIVCLVLVGGSALVFQTSTQALLLRMSALEYHGRLQSLVVLGFSGFGLAALPLGLAADATSVRSTLTAMGGAVLAMSGLFAWSRFRARRRRAAIEIG